MLGSVEKNLWQTSSMPDTASADTPRDDLILGQNDQEAPKQRLLEQCQESQQAVQPPQMVAQQRSSL